MPDEIWATTAPVKEAAPLLPTSPAAPVAVHASQAAMNALSAESKSVLPVFLRSLFDSAIENDPTSLTPQFLKTDSENPLGWNFSPLEMAEFLDYPDMAVRMHFAKLLYDRVQGGKFPSIAALEKEEWSFILTLEFAKNHFTPIGDYLYLQRTIQSWLAGNKAAATVDTQTVQ